MVLFEFVKQKTISIANHISLTKELHYGVLQGSVLAPLLFILYIQPLNNLITLHSLSVHLFTDDTQIKITILPQHVHSAITSVETCISDITNLMISNS